jgi:D-serine dehydratase
MDFRADDAINAAMTSTQNALNPLDDLRAGKPAVWMRESLAGADALSGAVGLDEVEGAAARLARFAPTLARLFADSGWDGLIRSELLDYPNAEDMPLCLVKADHDLPMTGSIKARGGVHELLCFIERIALDCGLVRPDENYALLAGPDARRIFADYRVIVASTGNLGYSIGLVARAFGMAADVHMSHEAKLWKKERLRQLGATVFEQDCDYGETVARARAAAFGLPRSTFVDDENSRDLLTGYAVAANELKEQLDQRHIIPSTERPIVLYLPCGIGGAPGGITLGIKSLYGKNAICVFVEPVASACVMVALASGSSQPPSVYEYGMNNRTLADGLAVPRASRFVMESVGDAVDAVVAVEDSDMLAWTRRAWREAGLRLEPSAAAAFAAIKPFSTAAKSRGWTTDQAIHIAWATGGSRLPDKEFALLLEG